MKDEVTRLMAEVAVSKGLKDMREQFNRRTLRNAVEHGGRFSHGRFQRTVFETLEEMLRSDDHPYYALCRQIVRDVDDRFVLGHGINMVYESWTRGAAKLRGLEADMGCNIPWCLTVRLSRGDERLPLETCCALIDQGMRLGVMSYFLEEEAARAEVICQLSERYPQCALTVTLPDDRITDALLDAIARTDNVALVAQRRTGAFTSGARLRAHRRGYALCREYGLAEAEALLQGADLRPEGDPDAPLVMYRPLPDCPDELCARLNDYLLEKKRFPTQPVFPVELSQDLARVDRIISTDDCALTIGPDGAYLVGNRQQPTALAFPQTPLADALGQLLKKE